MEFNDGLKIGLYSEYFAGMRNDLDYYIRGAYPEMQKKDAVDSTITLKIDLSFMKRYAVYNSDSSIANREEVVPEIRYRVSMDLKSKIETRGVCVDDGKEVVRGKHDFYIVPKEVAEGQMDMFNSFNEIEDGVDE